MAEFWTSQKTAGDNDPKRGFRFRVQFDGLVTGPVVWFAKKVTKPSFSITEAKHSFLNHSFYYPGRVEWQELTMTLVDPVSPGAIAQTNAMIQAAGYVIPTGQLTSQDLSSMSKGKAATAVSQNIHIVQINSDGIDTEDWNLINPFIKNVKFGDLDYSSDDLLEIELTLRYDYAICEIVNAPGADTTNIPNALPNTNKFYSPGGQ